MYQKPRSRHSGPEEKMQRYLDVKGKGWAWSVMRGQDRCRSSQKTSQTLPRYSARPRMTLNGHHRIHACGPSPAAHTVPDQLSHSHESVGLESKDLRHGAAYCVLNQQN